MAPITSLILAVTQDTPKNFQCNQREFSNLEQLDTNKANSFIILNNELLLYMTVKGHAPETSALFII